MIFDLILTSLSLAAGLLAAITGFGIGSLLTPLLSLKVETKLAIAAISIPHFVATLLRFWILRRYVDRQVLLSFGIMSATGGLIGALLHMLINNQWLTKIFAILLIFTGITGITNILQTIKIGKKAAYVAGAISGIFGGLAGNQGGIRAAGLLSFNLSKESFVATTTATGVIVDLVRMPIYFVTFYSQIFTLKAYTGEMLIGVIAGTILGMNFLEKISEKRFHRIVAFLILSLGIFILIQSSK
ncbi:MAG: sulfite exporter TauE/SafE family protein [Oligoflexia bacterium]|nr:sulfite exporter TauE/SafE family protein [Oligoflexia bacterium]